MESKKGIQLIKFKSNGEIELSIEGIQLLQSLPAPLGIVSIIGPPSTGKSALCNKILGVTHGLDGKTTSGIWAWSETLKVIKRDEDGTEYKGDILVIDCEAVVARLDKNKTRGLEILTLACLISSHIVYLSDQPFHTQTIQDLDIFGELPNLINVRKHIDSFKSLYEYMPVLTWVILGPDIKAPEDTASSYFEKILSKQTSAESSKIKSAIKSFFRVRNCFNAVSGNKGQYHKLVEYIQQSTPNKTIFNKNLSGPILCSILQTYANRLQKKSPAVIQSAFNRAVAAEARKNIEKLYVDYLESMGKIESKIPCSEEELWTNHAELSANLLERFDSQMQDYSECEEILSEKNTVLHRMKSYYEELKDSNSRISEEKSKKLFKNLFEATKNDEDFIENITENEEKLITSIKQYYDKAQGPSAYKVFLEEIMSIVAFLCDNLRDSVQQNETNFEDLTQEIENLKKNREKSRQNEERLKELLEETIKNYEKQLENKEKIISELQSSFSTKANIFETKVKNLTREIKSLQQELDHEQKEKEALLDVEKEIFNNKRLEFEETISKLKEENSRLERENEEILTTHEQSLSAKASEIIELKNREKFSEAPTESLENYSILNGLKQDLAEIFTKFNNEQTTNIKLVAQMDKIASLQSELNKFRLKEIENRNKLIDDYEEKISNLKDNNEELLRACSEFKRTKSLIPRNTEIEDLGDKVSSLENNLNRKTEQIDLLNDTIQKRDDQIQALYKVIEVHKKQFEELETSVDDKDNELHKVKIELVQLRDDSDTLIGLMGYALEVLHKKRNIQAISLTQIQNMNNRARVAKIFKKFGIPFE